MMALVLLALPMAYFGLDPQLGVSPSPGRLRLSDVFDRSNPNLNWLSLARLFLFASRDFWFEVPLPFFLRSPSCSDDLAGELDEHTSGDLVSLTLTKS